MHTRASSSAVRPGRALHELLRQLTQVALVHLLAQARVDPITQALGLLVVGVGVLGELEPLLRAVVELDQPLANAADPKAAKP